MELAPPQKKKNMLVMVAGGPNSKIVVSMDYGPSWL